jgi:hypothetical protein
MFIEMSLLRSSERQPVPIHGRLETAAPSLTRLLGKI